MTAQQTLSGLGAVALGIFGGTGVAQLILHAPSLAAVVITAIFFAGLAIVLDVVHEVRR